MVAPPDQTEWWDADATTTAALEQLRLEAVDVDAVRVAELVPTAGAAINDYLDVDPYADVIWPGVDPPAPLADAVVQVVVELYRRKDAPASTADGMMLTAWRPASFDVLAGVRALIRPYKRRFGVG
jgi:hypothetical protein